jgi:hypothetical protein
MGLIRAAGPSWAYCSHNLFSVPTLPMGTSVTPGLSNADGSAVKVLPALSHDAEYLRILIENETVSSSNDNDVLISILIDPAGGTSWSTVIPYLLAGVGLYGSTNSSAGAGGQYDFPIWIPAGASIGAMARGRSSTNAQVQNLTLFAYGGNANPASWWCGQRVSAIGVDAANAWGQSHTAGAATTVSVTGAADNGSGAIRLTVSSTSGWSTGDQKVVASVGGTTEANGSWTITVIDGTHIDLQGSVFSHSYTSGGTVASPAYSSWTNLGSALSADAGAFQWGVGGEGDATWNSVQYQFEFGVGGDRIGAPVFRRNTISRTGWWLPTGPIFRRVASGAQLQVRAKSGDTSPQALGVAAWAVH